LTNKKSGDAIVSAVEEEVNLLNCSLPVYQRMPGATNPHHFVDLCEIMHNALRCCFQVDETCGLLYTISMTWNYLLFVILTLGLTLFLGYGTYATARLLRVWRPEQNLLLMPTENFVRVVMLLFCVALGYLSGIEAAQLGWQWPQPALQLLIGVVTGLATALFFYYSTRQIVRHSGARFYSPAVMHYIIPKSRREFLLVLLALIPVVLLEELLFRSLLLGGLSPLAPEIALLIGFGLVFGLFHSPQGIWGMIGAGLGGIIFGLLFLWQQSLLAPVVAHYVANAAQIGVAVLVSRANLDQSTIEQTNNEQTNNEQTKLGE
jgi:membrane protease YdiL (CAAX protease family)